MQVSADLQLLLLVPPQLQQDSGSGLTAGVPPAQDVRRSVRVVAQLQQVGEDVAVNASGARLLGGEKESHERCPITSLYLATNGRTNTTITSVQPSIIHLH